MDRISGLSDDLLVKILWFLKTKDAVSTIILSERWRFLWMWLPKLDYYTTSMSESKILRCFLNRALPLHKAPVIESFSLELTRTLLRNLEDINRWVEVAVSRHVRELSVYTKASYIEEILPSSLYDCKSLEILKLAGGIYLNAPPMSCLPSLKTLLLQNVSGGNGKALKQLLSVTPVLEDLSVFCWKSDYWGYIVVNVPSLQRLTLCIGDEREGVEIDTPSLKYLKLEDNYHHYHESSIKNMPELEEAYVDVEFEEIENLIGSITSVKRLTLCCPNAVYSGSFVFNRLVHLKLCGCRGCSSNVLARLLIDSPKLQVLDIFEIEDHGSNGPMYWNLPSSVPECFLSSLQTFSWSKYLGRPQDRDVVVYILENAFRLKTVTISSSERSITKKFQMMKELSSSPRASTTCKLLFD